MKKLLVANRGEIACRVIRTCRALGVETVAVYSDADADALHVAQADHAVRIGPAAPAESYLNVEAILKAAVNSAADAVHPGYGFLSENADFARAVTTAGIRWVGPDPTVIELMGDKVNARAAAQAAEVPVAPGSEEPITNTEEAIAAAPLVGYPLMVKAAAGGGGIGMVVVNNESELQAAVTSAAARAERFFGSPRLLLEAYLSRSRHVEVQILGLATGQVVALGERDCSVQRRHQKLVEETPAPHLESGLRGRLLAAAIRIGEAVSYRGAGTVEFLVYQTPDGDRDFVFLEMNTRLQVEHPITEMTTGVDLVAEQLHAACQRPPEFDPAGVSAIGTAIEFRIYAEDPVRFLPRPGTITTWQEPSGAGIRMESGYQSGNEITAFYDPLLAKLCVYGATRDEALDLAHTAIDTFVVDGVQTNLPFFKQLLDEPTFHSGVYDTGVVDQVLRTQT